VRLSGVCIAGVAGVCVLSVLNGAGAPAFVTSSAGTSADVVFAVNVDDPLGAVTALPPDLVLNPTDSMTLVLGGASTAGVVISFEELEGD